MVVKPTDPTKGGYKFLGWYFLDKPYDFNTPVTANFTLVANGKVMEVAQLLI